MQGNGATRSELARAVVCALGLVTAATISSPAAAVDRIATDVIAATAMATGIAPSPLLSIDQNRTTVVDRVVANWGDALVAVDAGLTREQLRTLLTGLRSDQLLAASLAGSLEGLRNVIANALTASAPVAHGLLHTKALGDANADLVYTPVTPCREVDTRNAGGPLGTNSSRDFKVWVSSGGFTAQGGSATNCNIPANPAAVVVNITAVAPAAPGNFIAYPTGTPTFTSVVNYQSGQLALANGAIVPVCTPNCANQLTIATNGGGADVVIDIVGFFRPPSGPPVIQGNRVFSGAVTPNGTPQMTGFTVVHTAATGLYRLDFPAGTFTGSTGKFPVPAVTPISANNTWVTGITPNGAIAADGSASFNVQFANGETSFTFVVAVSIS